MTTKGGSPVQFAPVGQPETPAATPAPSPAQPAPAGPQAEGQQPNFVTLDVFESRLAELRKEAQSMTGKAEARIQKRLEDLKKAGFTEATPEQAKALLAAEDAGQDPPSTPKPQGQPATPPPAPVTPVAQPPSDPVIATASQWMKADGLTDPDPFTAEAYQMMARAGVRIEDNDPEAKKIVSDQGVSEFFSSVKQAIEDKSKRIGNKGNPARMPNFADGKPGGAPAHVGLNGAQTLEAYFKSVTGG